MILDERQDKVRDDDLIRSIAVQIAIGMKCEGQRQALAVETAKRGKQSHWKNALVRLTGASPHAVHTVAGEREIRARVRKTAEGLRPDGGLVTPNNRDGRQIRP